MNEGIKIPVLEFEREIKPWEFTTDTPKLPDDFYAMSYITHVIVRHFKYDEVFWDRITHRPSYLYQVEVSTLIVKS